MAAAREQAGERVCLGVIVAAHGVRGQVRIKPFTEAPEDVAAYGTVEDEAGARRFEIEVAGRAKGTVIARIEGVEDRTAAERLRGTRLYVDRAALPAIEEDETYYHADLIGLAVEDRAGRPLGRVVAVNDFGAGDVLELEDPEGAPLVLPFTRQVVPVVDLEGGRLVAEPPADLGGPEDAEEG